MSSICTDNVLSLCQAEIVLLIRRIKGYEDLGYLQLKRIAYTILFSCIVDIKRALARRKLRGFNPW